MVGVDLETTGVGKRDAICQLALEIFVPGLETAEYKTLVNPIIPIPAEATAIHGITNEMVADAPTFRMLAKNLHDSLTNCDFCGKNIKRFDLPMLREEFNRAGYDWDYEGAALIEVERLWQLAEPRRLSDAAVRWGTPEDVADIGPLDAHDALADVRWSTRVAANQIAHLGMHGWSPDQVHQQLYPDSFDAEGKLRRLPSGQLALTFSEHKDIPLINVNLGFLRWILTKDFSPKVKGAVLETIQARGFKK